MLAAAVIHTRTAMQGKNGGAMRALRSHRTTGSLAWSSRKKPFLPVEKGPMLVRNLDTLLAYSVDDCGAVAKNNGISAQHTSDVQKQPIGRAQWCHVTLHFDRASA
jgi:hypothetical protein